MIRTEERKRHSMAPTHWKWGTDQGSGSTTALAISASTLRGRGSALLQPEGIPPLG